MTRANVTVSGGRGHVRVAFTLREAFFLSERKTRKVLLVESKLNWNWKDGVALAGKEEEELTERKAEALSGARGDAGCDA